MERNTRHRLKSMLRHKQTIKSMLRHQDRLKVCATPGQTKSLCYDTRHRLKSMLLRCTILVGFLSLVCIAPVIASTIGHTQPTITGQQTSSDDSSTERPKAKSYTLPPDRYEKALAYSRIQYALHFIGIAYSLLVLLAILALRIAPIFRDWAERVSHRRIVQAFVFVPLLLFTCNALELPLDAYHHHLALRYAISIQSWGSWLWDWTKGQIIEYVFASILAYILYAVIRRSRRRWWLYFGLASLPMLVFLLFISPLVIDPLFNRF